MHIKNNTVVLESGDLLLEYVTFGDEEEACLVLVNGINADLTACGRQYIGPQKLSIGNPNLCPQCKNSRFHKMRRY